MRIKFFVLIISSILMSGNIYSSHPLDSLTCGKNDPKKNSSYSKLDSIEIKYWMLADASVYNISIKNNIVVVKKENGLMKKINSDTATIFEKYLDDLFVSGREKTEIGKTYSSLLVFADYPLIEVSLYAQGGIYLTHKVYLGMENYQVEFSKTFTGFYKLLRELCKQVETK